MYQKIFVPIDTSESSSIVLEEVKRLAGETHARVCLVKVIDTAQFANSPDELLHELRLNDTQRLLDARRESLQKFLAEGAELLRSAGIEVEIRLVEKFGGKVSSTLVEEAGKWGADLLVMGTHGRGGLTHLLMGSVAEGVIRHAKVPVLLVKLASDDE